MIKSLDHLVMTVSDIKATCDFYSTHLGMRVVTFGDNRVALHFGDQKINLHQKDNAPSLVAASPTVGGVDLCFLTDVPVREMQADLEATGIAIICGPIARTGAQGPILSIYIRDPDQNLIELANQLP